jgi:regulator of sirC expression with transglutaminase-like and TPR domain
MPTHLIVVLRGRPSLRRGHLVCSLAFLSAMLGGVFGPVEPRDCRADDSPKEILPGADAQISRWIADLDADSFAKRDRATKELQRAGARAFPALAAATRNGSPEVRQRAAFILRDAHWRLLHGDFAEFAARSEERMDVEYGMWLIARIVEPHVKFAEIREQLDQIADRVRARLPADTPPKKMDPLKAMEALRDVLVDEYKFQGDVTDYRNPLNSSIAAVLRRKRGLPITLSHLAIAVGRRVGWPLEGIATPGRYLVKYDSLRAPDGTATEDLVFDPFAGKLLSIDELRLMFPGVAPELLVEPAIPRQSLIRMLNNLETHLYEAGDQPRAELALTCRLLLHREEDDF